MSDEPTLGEVMRQVQTLVRQVESLVKEMRLDYVRKDLYDTRHDALTRRVAKVEAEAEAQEAKADARDTARLAFQRQVIAGVIIGLILLVASTLVGLGLKGGVG